MTLVSTTSAQLGLGASVGLIGQLGPIGAASLRLFGAGLIMLAITRPWRLRYSRATLRAGVILGLVTAGMSILFMCAAARLPLGTASALEFLGPLIGGHADGIAALGISRSRGRASIGQSSPRLGESPPVRP